ncbi:MAG: ABC transporter permease [Actinomycetota bacterium]|nr:ABC transporter permease [Actinomycetota bacterium]
MSRVPTPDEVVSGSPAPPSRSVRAVAAYAFGAMLLRDLHVLTGEKGRFLVRTVSQPLLLVFVFTYVFPAIGQGLDTAGGRSFTDVLVPGVLAITVMIKGIQAVALPLVQEFGYTREIDDRVMAPLPVWAVALEKIVAGAAQGLLGAVVVFPIVRLVPAQPPDLVISWGALVAVCVLGPVVASAFGLVLGTYFEPDTVPLMFSVIILPLTFLGATYYSWADLGPIPWLQAATLANPLVYIAEGFRLALTPHLPHMQPHVVFAALVVVAVVVSYAGVRGFQRRVLG